MVRRPGGAATTRGMALTTIEAVATSPGIPPSIGRRILPSSLHRAWADETSIGRDIPITLDDVRQIQLAKASLYTASHMLLRELGITTPDKIILAGAFGSHIDTTKAMILGMIPDCPLDRVFSVGNAAGDGARIALLNRDKRLEAQEIARTIKRVELPVDPDFQSEYMQAMNFPHMSHHFDAIADLIPEQVADPMAERLRNSR